MKSIFVKMHGPHRLRATDNDGNSAIVDRAGELQHEEQYDAAARALCDKLNWHGTLVKGYVLSAGITTGRVYVWTGPFATTLTIARPAASEEPFG